MINSVLSIVSGAIGGACAGAAIAAVVTVALGTEAPGVDIILGGIIGAAIGATIGYDSRKRPIGESQRSRAIAQTAD